MDLCVELVRGRVFIPFRVLLRPGLPAREALCRPPPGAATLTAAARVASRQRSARAPAAPRPRRRLLLSEFLITAFLVGSGISVGL